MAHFDYIKPGGVWGLLSLLSSAIMQEIDRRIYKTINGDEGGVWAPSSMIIIGGQGLGVSGPFGADDANIDIKNGKSIDVESGGTIDCQAGSIVDLAGTVTLTGTLDIDATATVNSEGTVNVTDGAFYFGGTSLVQFSASTVIISTVNVSSPGAIAVGNLGNISWLNGAVASYQSGSNTTFASGSNLTINGTVTQGSSSTWTLNGNIALGATAVVTTNAAASITLSCKPSLPLGYSFGGWVTRTTSLLDQYRHDIAPNVDTFFSRETRDVLQIPGDLGGTKSYKIGNPATTLDDDQCIFFYIYRGTTIDASDAQIRRGDNTLIATIKGTPSVPKNLVLIWAKSAAQWEIFSYSGAFVTDIT
jgi:hypothetical protein